MAICNISQEYSPSTLWNNWFALSLMFDNIMFAVKKITPGAHWIGITKIASKKDNADFNKTVFAYTKTSISLADAFISCWDEKYRRIL